MNCDEKTLCSESTRCTSVYLKTLQLCWCGSRKTGADSRMSLNQGNGSRPNGEIDVVNQNLFSKMCWDAFLRVHTVWLTCLLLPAQYFSRRSRLRIFPAPLFGRASN